MPRGRRQTNKGKQPNHARQSGTSKKRDAKNRSVDLLRNVSKMADPRKHKDFKKLKYSQLKALRINVKILAEKFHMRIGDQYRIGAPVKDLIKQFGLDAVLKYTEHSSPGRPIIPMTELRKAGIKAKTLLEHKVTFGALYHHGKYTLDELHSAGVPTQQLLRLSGVKGGPIAKTPKTRVIKGKRYRLK